MIWRYVKIPILVAPLAFLLPWMSVSLLGKRAITLTGWQLTSGQLHRSIGQVSVDLHGDTNYYFEAALGLIVLAAALSFVRRPLALPVIGASLLAMALIWAGSNQYDGPRIDAAATKVGGVLGSLAAAAADVNWLTGYWLAMAALALAAIVAWMAMNEARAKSPRG